MEPSSPPAHVVNPPRPGVLARLGPFLRLIAWWTLNAVLFAPCAAAVVYAAMRRRDLLEWARGCVVASGWLELILCGGLLLGVGVLGVVTGRQVVRVPWLVLEVRRLLRRTTPTLVTISIQGDVVRDHHRWWVILRGPEQERVEVPLYGLLPPWWLHLRPAGEVVLCYGWPPPGPYVLQFDDGWLALVDG